MEIQGVAGQGILTLTTSLSKPFTRLDKYISLLQELERHMEVQAMLLGQGWAWCLRRCYVFSSTIKGWEGFLPF